MNHFKCSMMSLAFGGNKETLLDEKDSSPLTFEKKQIAMWKDIVTWAHCGHLDNKTDQIRKYPILTDILEILTTKSRVSGQIHFGMITKVSLVVELQAVLYQHPNDIHKKDLEIPNEAYTYTQKKTD